MVHEIFINCLSFSITVLVRSALELAFKCKTLGPLQLRPTFTRAYISQHTSCDMYHRQLTFWHWSGVTPYTSSCEFAGSCVFDKQLPEILSLRPILINQERQALFQSYGCFFAEFLEDLSLVRLGLLDLITCVGLRYGFYCINLRYFSWKRAL